MKVIVKARHMNLTPALRNHAEDKLGTALARIFDQPAARVVIELGDLGKVHDGSKEVRVMVSMPGGKTLTVHEVNDDLYTAVNNAHDRILQLVKRAQGKRRGTSRSRKLAAQKRRQTARQVLAAGPELWERELRQYESTRPSV
jgi:ribosomal subunit interface protein